MLTKEQIQKEAERIHLAEQSKQQIQASSILYPEISIDDAYQIQEAWMAIKLAQGRKIVGHKIGLTSRAMQMAMGINEPDFGVLLDDMVFHDGASIQTSEFLDPRIEAELAFVLKKDLSRDNLSIQDVFDATEYVVPALELIAARSFRVDPNSAYRRTVKDTISDNAANAGIILGKIKMAPDDIDLRWVPVLLSRNETIEETGVAAGVLGHPAIGVAWLAKKYNNLGKDLKAGQIILAGSFTRPVIVKAGDSIQADYGPFGKINCKFV